MTAALAWEVDDPDGSVVYRGQDIELAEELYHSGPLGSHLVPVASEAVPAPLLSGGDE